VGPEHPTPGARQSGRAKGFKSFEDIEAWQKARSLARDIYLV
jgi:hypothetical protein